MTRQREFKERVRQRMEKTGERYTAARAQVLATIVGDQETDGGGFPFRPSVCRDTGVVRNMLAAAGVRTVKSRSKDQAALSESMVFGLSGGVGFLYIVFEYKGMPPILSVLMRHDTSQDVFVFGGLKRLGIGVEIQETTSAVKAEKALVETIGAGRSAVCVVDMVSMWPGSMPKQFAGQAPTVVGVTAIDGDDFIVDVGRSAGVSVSRERLGAARSAYKKGKHRMAYVPEGAALHDLAGPIRDAVAACADRYENAPYKGFASNFGLAGMEKWAAMLTDPRDKKGWPTIFPDGRLACLGLRRVYEGLQHEMTGPAGSRPMYATFLREAASITGDRRYEKAATACDGAAERWQAIATFIASCDVKDVRTGCDLLDSYAELLDSGSSDEASAAAAKRLNESSAACTMSHEDAMAIYRELAEMVLAARETEERLKRSLDAAIS